MFSCVLEPAVEVLPESSGTGALLAVEGGSGILEEFDETTQTGLRRIGLAGLESSPTGKIRNQDFGVCSAEKERRVPALDR